MKQKKNSSSRKKIQKKEIKPIIYEGILFIYKVVISELIELFM